MIHVIFFRKTVIKILKR